MTSSASWELAPELAQWSWFRDALHVPRPLPPLPADAWQGLMRMFGGQPTAILNGYGFIGLAPGSPPPTLERAPQKDVGAAWREFYLPRVKSIAERIRTADYDSLSASEIAEALPGLLDDAGIAFGYTMLPLAQLTGPLTALMAFCARHFGHEGDLIATTLLQGGENETAAAGDGLGHLASLASSLPGVRDALTARRPEAIVAAEGGEAWLAAFDAYLSEYGTGSHTWAELHNPTWQEDPSIPLEMIARYVESPALRPALARVRAEDARAATMASAAARLADDAERAELRALVAATSDYVPIIEERARWQLVLMAALRPACLALGRKLVAAGTLTTADDVFYLHLKELRATPADQRVVVAGRRVEVAGWRALAAPASVGAPLPPGFERMPMFGKMFGFSAGPAADAGPVKGQAASRGIVRGTARVILDLEDAHRLEPGEILVCLFTAPPWTPLFAIAGAVVTDAGGVLSHAAIAAREYGIPCVAGTRDGTRRIPDGVIVEVDGAAGTVTIVDEPSG